MKCYTVPVNATQCNKPKWKQCKSKCRNAMQQNLIQWFALIFLRIALHCLPCLWLWLPLSLFHYTVQRRKKTTIFGTDGNIDFYHHCCQNFSAQGSFAQSCATSNYWKLDEEEGGIEGWGWKWKSCIATIHHQHSHPSLPPNAAPFSLLSYWSALVSWEKPGFWLVEKGMGDLGELWQSFLCSLRESF